ncbi:LmbE-like protein [Cutaneotrichosporon oleaginosum]|uniref:N-acetylglucosaminylphosphatidylinositol deacetylase n=1 Tax=Cutaneotrichosporon oleaginosum TaxID=879819 RepID=A0A0J0XVI6_9TREE|nr:LmbE-like protein [Cutaneotrichosporon oleaginosum]KLT45087.1 LmbE-like protein [Cutaneotrichosporon oleaginosum]TXT09768.1 hypothetical protein COLE_03702 [Cutaneotrichosporon oleaginosum]
MTFLETARRTWTLLVAPELPTPFNYVPLVFRLLALAIAAPFVLFIMLEMVAYVITRTLRISISNLRVPRSPPAAPRDLEDDTITDQLAASKTPAETPGSTKGQPFARAFGAATPRGATTGALLLLAALFAAGVAGFQFIVTRANERTALALAEGFDRPAVLVLTAHPDDEAMFFGPTILNLVAAGWDVLPVCMSTGNAAGFGGVRSLELLESYARLGVSTPPVLLDNPLLPDSMGADGAWDPAYIAELVAPIASSSGATHLLTFDDAGVTQHPNHIALAHARAHLRLESLLLHSPRLATKFTGVGWAIFVAARDALRRGPSHHATFVSTPAQYAQTLYAMRAHASQLVWFRWLYVAFSRLMWVNQFN